MPTNEGIRRMARLREQTEGVISEDRPRRPLNEDGGTSIPLYPVTVQLHYEETPDGQLELIQDLPVPRRQDDTV